MSFQLDRKGGAEVLKMAGREINKLARKVADHAGEDAIVHEYTTDRPAAAVSVPADQQAKHGALTRAASASGLEVKLRR